MKRGAHRQAHRAFRPARLGDLDGALHRAGMARDDHLTGIVVVGGLTDLALRRLLGHRARRLVVEPQQRRHRADAHGHRLLHGAPAHPQQPRAIGDPQRSRRGQRGIFPQRMPGDEIGRRDIRALGLERAQRRERGRHQRGLCIGRQRQRLLIALPDQRRQRLAERRVDLVEHRARRRIRKGQIAAHADHLRALPRKYESPAHPLSSR